MARRECERCDGDGFDGIYSIHNCPMCHGAGKIDHQVDDMFKSHKAQEIARQIVANCDAYHAGQITSEAWDCEQRRLWKLAAQDVIMRYVMRALFPMVDITDPCEVEPREHIDA